MKKGSVRNAMFLMLFVLVLSGCASSMMVPTDQVIAPDRNYAVVNFLRPSMFGGAIKFGIWDKENLVGILTPKNYIQYKASPGEHIFMARAENWAVIKAKVEAGKTYYILGAPRMGAFTARVALEVLKPNDPRLAGWMNSLTPVTVDPAKKDAYVQDHLDGVRKAVKNVQSGTAAFDVMKPSDGK